MATTLECKKFLVDLFTKHPEYVDGFYDEDYINEDAIKDSQNIKLWKRERKNKIYSHESQEGENLSVTQNGIDNFTLDIECVIWERVFCLNPNKFEDTFKWLLYEDKNGELYLGEYIGD
jgi:hypothetical protein